jgi:exodeoxyribonuclease V beta subunit
MIHEIFEQIDFEQIDFAQTDRAALLEGVAASLRRHGLRDSLSEVLCAAIADVCATPLGGDASDFTLSQLPPSKRLDELEFTLPVGATADSSQEAVSPARLADVFSRHATAPAVIDYASRIGRLSFTPLAGHLRGFIDLVFEHAGRWYVVDYKSNLLGPSVDDYQPERLVPAMVGHDYVLQYHLYTVALHRYLALRLPSYSYAEHMGGVYYLFLRGMAPDHPAGSGVYHDRPPEALTVALSQLFGGSDPAESAP